MQHTRSAPAPCGDCDGFPRVVVTTGRRTTTGERHTIATICLRCRGTGSATPHTIRPASARHALVGGASS